MNPGRALDELIAEKVFGWKRQTQERDPQGWRDDRDWHYPYAKPWSSDLATAWEVIEKIRRNPKVDEVILVYNSSLDVLVRLTEPPHGSEIYDRAYPTTALSLCHAALWLEGIEV